MVFTGLWHVCMNGYFDMRHQYETRFYGCKHIRLEEYEIIQDEIQKRKSLFLLFSQLLLLPTSCKFLPPVFIGLNLYLFWSNRTIFSGSLGHWLFINSLVNFDLDFQSQPEQSCNIKPIKNGDKDIRTEFWQLLSCLLLFTTKFLIKSHGQSICVYTF